MRCIRQAIIWLALLCAAFATHAFEPLVGSPPYQRHVPDIDVYPQNFAIAQDTRGIVYVGNSDGVLEFDGERWSLLRLPNREIVRSLAMAGDGRVYVGGYNAFGYLKFDVAGNPEFVDLTPRFRKVVGEREFADIWDIVVAPEGVYFRAVRDVFFWKPGTDTVAHWYHDGRFGAISHHAGKTLLQFRGEGFKQRVGEGWELLPATRHLTTLIYQLLPQRDGRLLTMGSDGAWRLIGDDGVTVAAMPAGMPTSAHFENSLILGDGSLAFASRDGVVYILDPERRSERHFKVDDGDISGLFLSQDGGFLASANQAIYRIAWPAQWSVLDSGHGAAGSLQGMADWDGVPYLMSSSGALRASRSRDDGLAFEPDPWGALTVHDLLPLGPDRALLARGHRLALVEANRIRDLSEEQIYPRMFRRSRFHPSRVFLGTEVGLRVLDIAGPLPSVAPAFQSELAMRVASLAETSASEVWFGTERHGLWRYRFGNDGSVTDSRRFGESDGLVLGPIQEATVTHLADGSLMVGTNGGLFRLQGGRFVESGFDGLASLRAPDEVLRLVESPLGEQWAYSYTRLFWRPKGGEWREQDIRNLRRGALQGHHFDADGRALFISAQAILLHDAGAVVTSTKPPSVMLRQVTMIHADGRHEPLSLRPDKPIRMTTGDFGVSFQFAVPDLATGDGRRYQGRLLGYEPEFSEWSKSRGYTYSRISPGEYQLQVRAMDSHRGISEITPYALVIEPRWYASFWAKAGSALLLVVAVWLMALFFVRRRTQRLAGEKLKLETTVESRTRDLADANRRLEMMANVDGLTGIANRRRLDEYLDVVWAQCRERSRPLSVLAIDVDHFKQYNDRHGHLAGDELLKQLVQRLSNCLRRAEDLLARYGGEEFLVVLPGADLIVAHGMAETMRQTLEASELGVTISVGVGSRVPGPDEPVTSLVERADAALYTAKGGGRNRVDIHRETDAVRKS